MEDQPALRPDGKLLDVSQIEWFHDPDDPQPMRPIAIPQGVVFIYLFWSWLSRLLLGQHTCPVRIRNTNGARMAEAIATEKLDEFGNLASVQTRRLHKQS